MSCKEASNKKCSENKLQFKLKNIMNDIFKSFENLNMTLKTPKNQKFKKSNKEASNEKNSENKIEL